MDQLINWSAQFLKSDKVFVDIGEPLFTPIYKNCQKVIDVLNDDHIQFIKIFDEQVYTLLKDHKKDLKKNGYPTILFKYTNEPCLLQFLKDCGYQLISINNYPLI